MAVGLHYHKNNNHHLKQEMCRPHFSELNWERCQMKSELMQVIYTTNAIEAVHRQFRKLTKTKGAFPKENSLLKLLYMGVQNASKNWTIPLQNWNLTLSQLAVYFEGKLDDVLDI
jgi:transposase-like protein